VAVPGILRFLVAAAQKQISIIYHSKGWKDSNSSEEPTGITQRTLGDPGGKREGKENVKATVNRHLMGLGIKEYRILKIGEIHHSITRYKIKSPLFVFSDAKSPRSPESSWRWVPIASLERYPLSSLSLKAVRLFTER